jgi:predicted nucleotidyltransferase component of viral defense system
MIPLQLVRRYAHNQQVDLEVADQEVVLHYALGLLNQAQLVGRLADGSLGPLLFKGGTALRKCLFGSEGRFSQDIDLDAPHKNGFEASAEAALVDHSPFQQEYLSRVEFDAPTLHGLDHYEMIGEKIMACNRRQGGSAKDIYDLYLWSKKPFDAELVRRVAVLKAWTDQRRNKPYDPENLLAAMVPANFRWSDLNGLVPRKQHADREMICRHARERFAILTNTTEDEQALLADQSSHREVTLFNRLVDETREMRLRLA